MSTWLGYFALEDINLNVEQRNLLRNVVLDFYIDNQISSNQPNEILHWRVSLDKSKIILEAKFNSDFLTVDRFKSFIANLFRVNENNIEHSINTVQYDEENVIVMTLSYNSINRLRVGLFGGINSSWNQSHKAVLGYLDSNRQEWDES